MMGVNTFYKYESFDFMMIMIWLRNDINHGTGLICQYTSGGHFRSKFPVKTSVKSLQHNINRQIMSFP